MSSRSARFCICYARQQAVPYFREVAELLRLSLRDLGCEPDVRVAELHPHVCNIILDYHNIPYSEDLRRFAYVPYQLEQLSEDFGRYTKNARKVLDCASWVWEYAQENREFLHKKGIDSVYAPLGWHPGRTVLPETEHKDIDVLFYGALNERRIAVLEQLLQAGVNLKVLQDVWGEERDAYIARSKIVLNVHYYPTMIMETVRLCHLLNNKICVVSEAAAANPLKLAGLFTAEYEKLAPACLALLRNETMREDLRNANAAAFAAHYPMVETVRRALQTMGMHS